MGSNQSNISVPLWDPVKNIKLSTYAEFENDWFEQGVSRFAYKGVYKKGAKGGGKCVVKLYKTDYYTKIGESAIEADARSSIKSKELADRFNFDIPTSKPIQFLIPTIAKVESSARFNLFWFIPIHKNVKGKLPRTTESSDVMLPKGANLAVEDFIHGQYLKFLSNGSWVNTEELTYGPAAFAHYTYHVTRGTLLVCDLQGVREIDRYLLTDPAIHDSVNGPNYYGPTDFGVVGIVRFFTSHVCNDICRGFIRPNVKFAESKYKDIQLGMQILKPRHRSTYTYELENGGVNLRALRGIKLPILQE